MNDGKIIIDKIIAEAEEVAKASLAKGQKEADAVLKAAQEKVNKELDVFDRNAQAKAEISIISGIQTPTPVSASFPTSGICPM